MKEKRKVKREKEKKRDLSLKIKENPSTHPEALDSEDPTCCRPIRGGALSVGSLVFLIDSSPNPVSAFLLFVTVIKITELIRIITAPHTLISQGFTWHSEPETNLQAGTPTLRISKGIASGVLTLFLPVPAPRPQPPGPMHLIL